MTAAEPRAIRLPPQPIGSLPAVRGRVRVDGKFLARAGRRFRVRGVTYGPFAPDPAGQPFPPADQVVEDFARMRSGHVNTIRTYHLPPEWLLRLTDEQGMSVLIDVPWPKHLCFLDSATAQAQAREAVRRAAERGRQHPAVLAYSICNEIPPAVVRWHGVARVERFLKELADVARQADPEGLVTYANFPSTEYLNLTPFDFITFNVYLHDPRVFHRYLFRLQNLAGEKPLLLGEIGMDTIRHGEDEQALFLAGHVREATLLGLAGVVVFSWTDDWHTGGYPITDWAFGITTRDRSPKAAYHALGDVFGASPADLLPATPRVSVVVCTYNGGRTLAQCLRSLRALDYPNYEVIVVDDGSTDDTGEILQNFPEVRAIRQANHGLSHARNVGLRAATGTIVAYTDSDCFAHPDWLTHLVDQLERGTAAGVGGPNLSPEDGWLAACVAACPGQPTHVLANDQEAEHIPGCNMAFRREALLAVGGFDEQYRKAGDDVDLCWRLQQAGYWITFAPAAFVWHHRRQTPRTYLKQQAGYGEAEALLSFKHPDRFNSRGDGKWRGVLYGPSLRGLRLARPIIYRGTFGTGLFQTLYQPGPAHWAMLPGTLEWQAVAVAVGLLGLVWTPAWLAAAAMLVLSLGVAALQAGQAHLEPRHEGFKARLLVAVLSYLQPLVRSGTRYRTRLFAYRRPKAEPDHLEGGYRPLPLDGRRTVDYWSETGGDRTEIINRVAAYLAEHGWGKTIDSGWADWDLEVFCHPWTVVQISTAQEDHGGGKRLIRVRYRLKPASFTLALGVLALGVTTIAASWPTVPLVAAAAALVALCGGLWWLGTVRAYQAEAVLDATARKLGLIRYTIPPEEAVPARRARPRRLKTSNR